MTVYTVKEGDTLESIAERELGDRTRWAEIARASGFADPDNLRPGMRVHLPPKDVPPTLRKGARGPTVRRLQQGLQRAGIEVADDGVFGSATEAAVRAFQTRNRLGVDGVVGPATWRALLGEQDEEAPAPPPDRYAIEPGDTLRTIAAKTLGDGGRWTDVLEQNLDMLPADIGADDELPFSGALRLPRQSPPGDPPRRGGRKWLVAAAVLAWVFFGRDSGPQVSLESDA